MKRWLLLMLLALAVWPVGAQPDKVYTSLKGVKDYGQVYELKLRYKRLRSVPKEVFGCTNLRKLDLSRNFIDSIPPEIAQLSNLEELNVARNWLRHLPDEVGTLSKLSRIDLSRNPMQHLPAALGALPHLERLVVWQTGVIELPPSFVALDGVLEVLDMRGCPLTESAVEGIRDLLPKVKILWDPSCNCATD